MSGRVAAALLVAWLVACASPTTRPADLDSFTGRRAVLCEERLRTLGIDADFENAPAAALASTVSPSATGTHAIIVPGFTPADSVEAVATLHPVVKERLFRALLALQDQRAPFVIVSGGNVYPEKTPYNEAIQMKRYLRALGVPEERIFIEPCARTSYSNLRNSGRLLLSLGMWRGLIITSYDQAYYFSRPFSTTFRVRTMARLGYFVGDLQMVNGEDVSFVPSPRVFERSMDPVDP